MNRSLTFAIVGAGLAGILGFACNSSGRRTGATISSSPSPTAQSSVDQRAATRESMEQVTCPDAAMRIEGGVEKGLVCPSEAKAANLTIVELGDAWTPTMFAKRADGPTPEFHDKYLELAGAKLKDSRSGDADDALGELYGVVPSFAIVRERLADEQRHACHAAIDSAPLALLEKPYGQDHGPVVKAYDYQRRVLEKQLAPEVARRKLADLAALAALPDLPPALAQKVARWKMLAAQKAGIIAAQKHFLCEGTLAEKYVDGTLTWRTGNAAELFQRRNFLMPNERIDPETREALATDSRELDFRLALRILRERVVDATGLIEDGTASDGPKPILGRMLDPAAMRVARGKTRPMTNGAPDLVSAATEAAARQLGWTGPTEVAAWFAKPRQITRVALPLPPVPAYHAAHMELSAVIDRGDVYYDEVPVPRHVRVRPSMVLYVDDNGTKRPLVRWPSTIGGWADVTENGIVVQKWKESDVGPRVWRKLYAAPTWLPPKTTPDRDLVKNMYNGKWELKTSIMGPGPHAAFGMALLLHELGVKKGKDGEEKFYDNGIGTHGSASVTSIVNGTSHGCHRLYNQLAVRLGNFLLNHRNHEVKGQEPEHFRRVINYKGNFVAKITTRGFLYEMTPPVPVMVTKGNIKTPRKIPPKSSAPARP